MKKNIVLAYNAKENLKGTIVGVDELLSRYDARLSFYGKAQILSLSTEAKLLKSYNTIVAMVTNEGKYVGGGNFSATTRRHQKEFYKQFGNGSFSNVTWDIETVFNELH